ncbi:MAG: cobalt ECF transporter T component CbiQ [Desulfamplus sp.]|nr:cobalt ECF transporter T component CbiQ [Desulfamplus sp.]
MANLQNNLFDIFYMDTLASGETWLHRLDPRAKVLTTLIFVGTVVSCGKYEISMLIPFTLYPVAIVALANLPVLYIIKKMTLLMPFAFFIGIFNPIMDRAVILKIDLTDIFVWMDSIGLNNLMGLIDIIGLKGIVGTIDVSGGWISFFSIMMRFCLTVGAALILICTTGFDSVCMALQKFGVPSPFIAQLMFLYRYMFVLIDEASRMVRARALRTFDTGHMKLDLFAPMIGQLLLRTLDRAQRIHLAMCCRGFDGHIRMVRKMDIGMPEILFTIGWLFAFVIFRMYNIPIGLGKFLSEIP